MLSGKDLKADNSAKYTEKTITLDRNDRTSWASWLFLIGSLIFLADGFLELAEGISLHALLHLVASFLFTIASALFIPTDKNG